MRDQQALAEHEERMNGLNGDGGKGGNKGIFSWFTRRLSKTEVTRRVSFRQKIIGKMSGRVGEHSEAIDVMDFY